MPFHCLVLTARYLGLTRGLLRWRWTMITMIVLYSLNLLHPLLQEEVLASMERLVLKIQEGMKKSFSLMSSHVLLKLMETRLQDITGCGKYQILIFFHNSITVSSPGVCYSPCLLKVAFLSVLLYVLQAYVDTFLLILSFS